MTKPAPQLVKASELTCGAAAVGSAYAIMQRENHLFQSCGAKEEELAAYGSYLYELSKNDPGSMCLELNGQCVGMYLLCDTDVLNAVDTEVLGSNKCKYHLAFCKDLQRRILRNYKTTFRKHEGLRDAKIKYAIFGGVLPDFEGTGIFSKMQIIAMRRTYDDKALFTWGFTHNPAIIHKSFAKKEGMPKDVKGPPVAVPSAVISSLVSLPVAVLRIIAASAVKSGAVKISEVHDVASFKYNGKKVFRKSQAVWLGVYTTDPAKTHGASKL